MNSGRSAWTLVGVGRFRQVGGLIVRGDLVDLAEVGAADAGGREPHDDEEGGEEHADPPDEPGAAPPVRTPA